MNFLTKYAPQSLDDLVYPSETIEKKVKAYGSGQLTGHIFLSGGQGSGKSSIAKLLPKTINPDLGDVDRLDIKCGQEGGPQKLAKTIETFSSVIALSPSENNNSTIEKFPILNELQLLSSKSQDLLLEIMERDNIQNRVMFIFTTTDTSKIRPTLMSRCDTIKMGGYSVEARENYIKKIAVLEHIELTRSQLNFIMRRAHEDFRVMLTELQTLKVTV